MSGLLERARAYAEQAANEYLASEAERIEQEAEGLRSLIAALVIENGGPIMVSNKALAQAALFACQMQFIEGAGLVVDVASEQNELALDLGTDDEPPLVAVNMHIDEGTGALVPNQPLIPSEPAETIPAEEPMEQTSDARADRYLATHQGTPARTGAAKPHMRPWDDPEDLQHQEVAQGRVEHAKPGPNGEKPDWYDDRATELASGAGEGVSVRIGS